MTRAAPLRIRTWGEPTSPRSRGTRRGGGTWRGAAAALRDATGASAIGKFRARHERRLATARADLGEAAGAAFAEGWAMPLEAAIEEALAAEVGA